MKAFFPAVSIVLFCLQSPPIGAQDRAGQLPAQAPPVELPLQAPQVVDKLKPREDRHEGYRAAARRAVAEGKMLVIFLGTPLRPVPGNTVAVEVDHLDGYAGPAVITGVPDGRGWVNYLATHAPEVKFREAAKEERKVSRAAVPFVRKARQGEIVAPDDDGKGRGPWPKKLQFPADLERYLPARLTQQTFNKGIIERVDRNQTEPHWQVPGGMLGVKGWRSDLYRSTRARPGQSWVPVENSFGAKWRDPFGVEHSYSTQEELAYTRSYPEGAVFMDVLSNQEGQVFEIRVREKTPRNEPSVGYPNGKTWESYVMFRDVQARPAGYEGLAFKCGECHNYVMGPGTGGYGVGLVAGGDTVFSDPLEGLE